MPSNAAIDLKLRASLGRKFPEMTTIDREPLTQFVCGKLQDSICHHLHHGFDHPTENLAAASFLIQRMF